MQAFVQDNNTKTMTLNLADLVSSTDGKKKDGCLKANFDFKICSSTAAIFCGRPVNSIDFLAPQSYSVQHVSADRTHVLREESHHLPVD